MAVGTLLPALEINAFFASRSESMQSSRTRQERITEHLLGERLKIALALCVHRPPLLRALVAVVVEPDAHPAAVGVHVVVVKNLQK